MAALGGIAALGLAPFGLWWATLGALVVMFWLFRQAHSAKQGAVWIWAFGAAYFAVALRWIVEPFQVDAATHGWMAPFALALMAGGLALFWAAAGWVAARVSPDARMRAICLVATVSAAELVRAYVFTGFPWAGLAQVWVDTKLSAFLAQIGPHGLALWTLAIAAAPSAFDSIWSRLSLIVTAAVAVVVLIVFGGETLTRPTAKDRSVVRIVQPNAPQHEKWDPEKAPIFFWRQVDATAVAPRPDLIVWPETAIPSLLHQAGEALDIVTEAAGGTPVVMGMQRAEGFTYRNAAFVLDSAGVVGQIYDKHHLVPFGEYIPFAPLLRSVGLRAIADQLGQGYAPGPGPQLLDLGALGKALPLICYEAVFPQHARPVDGQRPDFILQLTNDAWFGTGAGPQQHLAQARMRAIEQGLPLVRAANTGISAMIDANGRVQASLALGEQGHIDAVLPEPAPPTTYSRTSDWPIVAIVAAMLLGCALKRRDTV